MRIPTLGFTLPFEGDLDANAVSTVARAAEKAGFAYGWVGDHVMFPVDTKSANPTTRTGRYPVPHATPRLEAFGVLFTAAAVTSELRLGVGTAIAGYRPAPLLAKIAATLDILSGGRAVLALALGWLEEEFTSLGVPFHERRGRLEETIQVCRLLWTQPEPSFSGRYFSFGPSHFEPKPPQGSIPLFVGGHSEPALRRAGRLGDGWYGSRLRPEELAPLLTIIREGREEADRVAEPFQVALTRLVAAGKPDGGRDELPLNEPSQIREELEAYAVAGVDLVVITMNEHNVQNMLRAIDAIASVM